MPFKMAGLANKYGGLTNKNGGLMKKNGAFTVKKYQKVPFFPAEVEVLSTNCQADIGKSNYVINIGIEKLIIVIDVLYIYIIYYYSDYYVLSHQY